MANDFDRLALEKISRIVRASSGAEIADLSETGKRLYSHYAAHQTDGIMPAKAFSLPDFPDLMPSIGILDILPGALGPDGNLCADYIRSIFMGTEVDRMFGAQTGKRLSEFSNELLVQRSSGAVSLAVKNRTMIAGGALFERPKYDLVIQVMYIPMTTDETVQADSIINRVSFCVEQIKLPKSGGSEA